MDMRESRPTASPRTSPPSRRPPARLDSAAELTPPLSRKAPSPPPTTNSPTPTFADRVNAVVMCIGSQNALREALYKTLAFCEQPRDFTEVEDFIAATDEFVYSHIMQTPFTMIGMLTDAGGLSQTPLDEAGDPSRPSSWRTADEADDLVATYRIEATGAGREAVRLLAPERRIEHSFPCARTAATPTSPYWTSAPHRASSLKLKRFSRPRQAFPGHRGRSPSFRPTSTSTSSTRPGRWFGERAWVATDAGKQMLEAHKRQTANAR